MILSVIFVEIIGGVEVAEVKGDSVEVGALVTTGDSVSVSVLIGLLGSSSMVTLVPESGCENVNSGGDVLSVISVCVEIPSNVSSVG